MTEDSGTFSGRPIPELQEMQLSRQSPIKRRVPSYIPVNETSSPASSLTPSCKDVYEVKIGET